MDPIEGSSEMNMSMENSLEATYFKWKENDRYPQQPESCNVLESPAPTISSVADWHPHHSSLRSPDLFMETSGGMVLNYNQDPQSRSEPLCNSLQSSSDPVVRELKFRNYNSPEISSGDCYIRGEKMQVRKGVGKNFERLQGGPKLSSEESQAIGDRVHADSSFLLQFGVQRFLPYTRADRSYSIWSESDEHDISSNLLTRFPGRIQPEAIPASGFPLFQAKNILKGKGITDRLQYTHDEPDDLLSQSKIRGPEEAKVTSDSLHWSGAKADDCSPFVTTGERIEDMHQDEISLSDQLKARCRKFNKVEDMHIFKQILDLVHTSHAQGLVLRHLRPSYFTISPSNQVKYVGSFVPHSQMEPSAGTRNLANQSVEHQSTRKRVLEKKTDEILLGKHKKISSHVASGRWQHMFHGRSGLNEKLVKDFHTGSSKDENSECGFWEQSKLHEMFKSRKICENSSVSSLGGQQSLIEVLKWEERWYTDPEELTAFVCPFSTNIYSLGVLLFELLCYFESWELHSSAMSDLCHRILPAKFLSESPTEASFCLWMLHPDPSSRPKSRDILLCDLISGCRDVSSQDPATASVDRDGTEEKLLSHFLLTLKERKEKQAANLVEDLGCLKDDIDQVWIRRLSRKDFLSKVIGPIKNFSDTPDTYAQNELEDLELVSRLPMSSLNEARLMRIIDQLKKAYFSMGSKIQQPEINSVVRSDKAVLEMRNRCSSDQHYVDICSGKKESTDCRGAFFEGLCKYARYSKFEVCGSLRNVDALNSANVICSLSFDRDEDYFAAAGVSKKIKIYELDTVMNDTGDIHYPVVEMSSKSKLSCVCWNYYIKNYLASTDYDGMVQLWDASSGQGFLQYTEHQKRAWSVDFSHIDPTKLASGSDDCSVKLWSINEKSCINTIQNAANICCVQFSSSSSHLLAFGSADYNIYCYDLRNTRNPWCTLDGYGKTVSYVKFVDPETLVSASTDNSLRLWDLNKTNSAGLSTNACSLTMNGHTNEKNFVGLSVYEGYIACGSETNEVFSYYKTLPMPITSHKFGSLDPISGQETGDDNGQFVSSVCWRGKSSMVVAANSNGSIKLLQMV